MPEQRTRTSSVGPSTSFAIRKPRPQSITSIASLRQPSWKPGTHSRRQSVDSETRSVPSSPMTYFPPPSSFSQPLGHSNPPAMSARPASAVNLSTSFQASTSSHDSSDEEGMRVGERTPRLADRGFENSLDSPRSHSRQRRGTLEGPSTGESRKASDATLKGSRRPSKSFSTPVQGYGATHSNPPPSISALGLGYPEQSSRRGRRDDALASPRRISTSQAPRTAHPHRSPASLLGAPSHEAYYAQSQPATTTTPRFKDIPLPDSSYRLHKHSGSSQYPSSSFLAPSPRLNTAVPPQSLSSALNSPVHSAKSPGKLRSRLGRTASAIGISVGRPESYDGEDEDEDEEAEDDAGDDLRANGMRVWYSSFVTIDWMHDALKDSSRVKKLRKSAKRSVRGSIINSWDRFQGWLVVTIIGIITAIIAFMIVRSEMALFDLKEGFCTTSWGTPKRFCCSPHHQAPSGPGDEDCGDWMEWGQFLAPKEKHGREGAWIWGGPEFVAYLVVALTLAVLASAMTIYMSSSVHHTTSKDSTFLTPSTVDSNAEVRPAKAPSTSEREPLLESSVSTIEEEEVKRPPPEPRKVMYYAAGSGIPEIKTILSGFVIHGYLGGWTLLTKSVGLALSVASGLSLGKEGPLVHIASCVGNIVSRLFIKFEHNEAKRREVLSAACAAGVSVAFGAPIGGVLFSLEEVSYYFPPKVMWRSFWCAAVAAITLRWLNPFGNHSLVLFEVSYTKDYQYWEFGIFILLGIFGGLYGAIFSRLNFLWSKHVRQGTWLGRHPILEVLGVTLLTTVLGFLNPYCRMGGTELVASLFSECGEDSFSPLCVKKPQEVGKVLWPIFQALIIKGALTIITFGIKLPAGIFIPSLVVGACFGRIVGLILEFVEFKHPAMAIFGACKDTGCVVPGLYAMIGAAATLAGVTRTTVSLAVIMMELTGTLNYVVPVMLSILVAKTVADGLERKGIYDLVIDLNQLPYLDSKHEYMLGGHQAFEAADADVPVLRADKSHTVRSLTGKLLELVRLGMADSGFPILVKEIVEADGRTFSGFRLIGFLGMNELEHALSMLADEPDANVNLKPDDTLTRPRNSVMSIFSFAESFEESRSNPYDLSKYIDRAPITVQTHSPLELVQQLFVRLGARQIVVNDPRGVFRGLITKKAWLAYLVDLERG